MATIRELYGLNNPNVGIPRDLLELQVRDSVKSSELIGIEVEIENVAQQRGKQLSTIWHAEGDGSLRNGGMEFISLPMEAQYAPVSLHHLLQDYLNQDYCFSPRTSVHIHLNVQDISFEKVVDLVLLYTLYEKLLYRFTGRGRQKNIYCVPLTDTDLLNQFATRRFDVERWSKYTGLNLIPLHNYGTVEFRHMHGTNDLHKLAVWINLITKLKEYAKTTATPAIRQALVAMDAEYDYEKHLEQVFGEYAAYLRYQGPQDVSYLAVKQAMTSNDTVQALRKKAVSKSAFYQFK